MSSVLNIELLKLEPKELSIENIYVDPNNPRLMAKSGDGVPDKRILEKGIQKEAIKNTKSIGIRDITEKILKVGFLSVDRVVVRPLTKDKFVVIEGNRRITAIKTLLEAHKKGKITLDDEILSSMKNIEVLVYNGKDKQIAWFIQGLRHIHGIKNWGAWEQARFLVEMQERRKLTTTELSSMTGIGKIITAKLIRSYKAWEQARENEEFGDFVETGHFSLFSNAVFVKPSLRVWLEWDDSNQIFKNEENLERLLKFYLPHDDEEGRKIEPIVTRVIDVRDVLSQAVLDENKQILQKFENDLMTIDDLRKEFNKKESTLESKLDSIDLEKQVDNLQDMVYAIQTLPLPIIIKDIEKSEQFLEKLDDIISNALTQREIIHTQRVRADD